LTSTPTAFAAATLCAVPSWVFCAAGRIIVRAIDRALCPSIAMALL
jgi:hypothetical protein